MPSTGTFDVNSLDPNYTEDQNTAGFFSGHQSPGEFPITNSSEYWAEESEKSAVKSKGSETEVAADLVLTDADQQSCEQDAADANSAWEQFENIYLGAGPEFPIIQPNGDPLRPGDMFYLTAQDPLDPQDRENLLYLYNGLQWQTATDSNGVNQIFVQEPLKVYPPSGVGTPLIYISSNVLDSFEQVIDEINGTQYSVASTVNFIDCGTFGS